MTAEAPIAPALSATRVRQIMERDAFTCRKCEHLLSAGSGPDQLQVHHILPRRAGGTNKDDNLLTLCGRCHQKEDRATLALFPRQAFEPEDVVPGAWMTIPDAARLLGYKCSNVYLIVSRGLLKVQYAGPKCTLVDRCQVEALAAAGKPKRGRPRKSEGSTE